MQDAGAPDVLVLDIGSTVEALQGQTVCGDAAWVERLDGHRARLILADGLGHGEPAARAAEICVNVLAGNAEGGLPHAFREAHRALRETRGSVACIATLDAKAHTLEVSIVGNITMRLVGTRGSRPYAASAVAVPGVLGGAFRAGAAQRFDLEAGDLVLVHSDGVRSHFDSMQIRGIDAQSAASEIVAQHGRGRDDASCIVVRVLPPRSVVAPAGLRPAPDPGRQIPLRADSDVQVAATAARAFAGEMGMSGRAQWEVSIAAAELAQNVVKYGVEGSLWLRRDADLALVLEAVDRGPGFGAADPRPGLREGLSAIRRLMDSCDVHTSPIGTRVIAKKRAAAGG